MTLHSSIRLGIVSALQEEQHGLVQAMTSASTSVHGMRQYTAGKLWGIDTVCVLSRIGKVAAATTVTILIEHFGVTHIVFTGVAGAGDATVHVGDIVVAESLVQYDMDCSPLFPRHEVPLTGITYFQSDLKLSTELTMAANNFFSEDFFTALEPEQRKQFKLDGARIHRGLIASGDRFISSKQHLNDVSSHLSGLLAIEMEGAAVAQVCFELGVPYAVMRTISDNANEDAATDFMQFVTAVASKYAYYVVKQLCNNLAASS